MQQRTQARAKSLVSDAREVTRLCAGLNLRLAARRATRFLEGKIAEADLEFAQFGLLVHIAAGRDDTIGALAESLCLDQSTLSRNLRTLERQGLVEIVVAERDMRRRAVWLTEKGARRLEATIAVWKKAHAALSKIVDTRQMRKTATATAALS